MQLRRPWIALSTVALATTPTYALTIILNFNAGSSVNPAQDPAAAGLQSLFAHAESYYEDVFEDSHTITINFWYENLGGLSAHLLVSQGGVPNRETVANIRIDNNVAWFIDPTPNAHSEFTMAQTLWRDIPASQAAWYNNIGAGVPETFEVGFNGPAIAAGPADGAFDMLTVVMKAVGNALGMSSANTATQAETADGDYDYDPAFILGQSLAIEVSPFSIAFVENPEAMMAFGNLGLSERNMPSHSDLFAMASGHSYVNLDVPRREWYAGNTDWSTDSNWSGDLRPGSLDDAYVRDNGSAGTVTASLSGPGFAANLFVTEAANVDTNANKLDVGGAAVIADFNSDIIVDTGGEFEADSLSIENDAELFMFGGLVDVNTLSIDSTSNIRQSGSATVDVQTNLDNEGSLQSGGNGTLFLTTTGGAVWDLDGFSTGDGDVQAINGSIDITGGLTDSFNGTMSAMNGNSITISDPWTLSTGAIIDLDNGTLAGGTISMLSGTIIVTGATDSTISAPFEITGGSPSITVAGPGALNFTNPLPITGQLSFAGGRITGAGITNDGTTLGVGEIANPFVNNGTTSADGGTLHLSGAPDLDGSGAETGIVNAVNGDILVDDAFLFAFNGVCNIGNGRTYTGNNGLALLAPGQMNITGGAYVASQFQNLSATLNVNAGGSPSINAGTIRFSNGSANSINAFLRLIGDTTVEAGAAFGGTGQLAIPTGSSITLLDGAVVSVEIQTAGLTSIGASPGTAKAAGFQQNSTGTLDIEIGAAQFDQLIVTNSANLDGRLAISLLGGFVPAQGDAFEIITASTVSGQFSQVSVPSGAHLVYTPTSVIVLYCAADLNGDGVLDNGDIQAFIALFLAGDLATDFNGDGILDNGDIQAFIAAFLAGCS